MHTEKETIGSGNVKWIQLSKSKHCYCHVASTLRQLNVQNPSLFFIVLNPFK